MTIIVLLLLVIGLVMVGVGVLLHPGARGTGRVTYRDPFAICGALLLLIALVLFLVHR